MTQSGLSSKRHPLPNQPTYCCVHTSFCLTDQETYTYNTTGSTNYPMTNYTIRVIVRKRFSEWVPLSLRLGYTLEKNINFSDSFRPVLFVSTMSSRRWQILVTILNLELTVGLPCWPQRPGDPPASSTAGRADTCPLPLPVGDQDSGAQAYPPSIYVLSGLSRPHH